MSRYECPEVDHVWTERAKLERWLRVWDASNVVHLHPPVRFPVNDVAVAAAARRELTTGHDVAAAIGVVRDWLEANDGSEAARWLHWGLCSSDVVDAGWLIGMTDAQAALSALAYRAVENLEGLAARVESTEHFVYRTHGRSAEVAPGYLRWQGHADRITNATTLAGHLLPSVVGFNGPTGTGAVDGFDGRALASRLGLARSNRSTGRQCADRVDWARWLSSVAAIGTAAAGFALDVRTLALTSEAHEGRAGGYIGSSSMPHKSEGSTNPTRSERVGGLAAVTRGVARGYEEAVSTVWGSQSLEHSSAERLAVPLVTSTIGFILTEVAAIAAELVFDTERVNEWAEVATEVEGAGSYRERALGLRGLVVDPELG